MTDLNRKPCTIQMIQNDITLGRERGGSREAAIWLSPTWVSADLLQKLSHPQAHNALCWELVVFWVCQESLSRAVNLKISGKVRASRLGEHNALERKTALEWCHGICLGYRCSLKGKWGLEVFCLISHTRWSFKETQLWGLKCTIFPIRQPVYYSVTSKHVSPCLPSLPWNSTSISICPQRVI